MNQRVAVLSLLAFPIGWLSVEAPKSPSRRSVAKSSVVTLFRYDDIRRSFGFTTRDYGRVIQDGEVRNQNSEVMLWGDPKVRDELAFGCQGGDRAAVVDLGDLRDPGTLSTSYYRIDLDRAKASLADIQADDLGLATVAVELGHVYVVRLQLDDGQGEKTIHLRLRVIDHAPGRTVTLRWDQL